MQEGVRLLREGNAVQAVDSFRKATELRPAFAEAWLNLGLALQQTGNAPDALAALQKAIALKPNLWGVHLFLGTLITRTITSSRQSWRCEKRSS